MRDKNVRILYSLILLTFKNFGKIKMIKKTSESVKFHIVTNYIYFLYFQYFNQYFMQLNLNYNNYFINAIFN